jgi:DNA-binding CsgD family transcriptional regulator
MAWVDLSERQVEIIRRYAISQTTKEIALALGVSVKAVEYHRAKIRQRAGLMDVAAMTRAALRVGLLSDEDLAQ